MAHFFCIFPIVQFSSNFAIMWSKYVSNNVWRELRLLLSEFATVARKSFMLNLLQNCFSNRTFCDTISDPDIRSLNFLHTLFDK